MNMHEEPEQPEIIVDELLAVATEFTFYPDGATEMSPETYLFTMRISYRAPGLFAVTRIGECWTEM